MKKNSKEKPFQNFTAEEVRTQATFRRWSVKRYDHRLKKRYPLRVQSNDKILSYTKVLSIFNKRFENFSEGEFCAWIIYDDFAPRPLKDNRPDKNGLIDRHTSNFKTIAEICSTSFYEDEEIYLPDKLISTYFSQSEIVKYKPQNRYLNHDQVIDKLKQYNGEEYATRLLEKLYRDESLRPRLHIRLPSDSVKTGMYQSDGIESLEKDHFDGMRKNYKKPSSEHKAVDSEFNSLMPPHKEDIADSPLPKVDYEKGPQSNDEVRSIIADLDFLLEGDTEIIIKYPSKREFKVTPAVLGYQKEDPLPWHTLISIMSKEPHEIELGPAHTWPKDKWEDRTPIKEYGKQYQRLRTISRKLITLLNDRFKLGIPKGKSLFEIVGADKKRGVFKPIFNVVGVDDERGANFKYDKDEDILKKLRSASKNAVKDLKNNEETKAVTFAQRCIDEARSRGLPEKEITKAVGKLSSVLAARDVTNEATSQIKFEHESREEKDY